MHAESPGRMRRQLPIVSVALAVAALMLFGGFAAMGAAHPSVAVPGHPVAGPAGLRVGTVPARGGDSAAPWAHPTPTSVRPSGLQGPIGGRLYSTTVTAPRGYTSDNQVAVDPVTQVLYTANFYQGVVNMIAIPSGTLLHSLQISTSPYTVAPSSIAENHSLNRVYVGVQDYATTTGGFVLVLNASTLEVVANVSHLNGTTMFQPAALLYDPASTQVLVENTSNAIIAMLNTTTNSIVTVLPSPCLTACFYTGGMTAVPRHHWAVIPTGEFAIPALNTTTNSYLGYYTNPLNANFTGGSAAYDPTDDWVMIANSTGNGDIYVFNDTTGLAFASWVQIYTGFAAITWDDPLSLMVVSTLNFSAGGQMELWTNSVNGLGFAHFTDPSAPFPNFFSQLVPNDQASQSQVVTAGPFNDSTRGFDLQMATPIITPAWGLLSIPVYQYRMASDSANGLYYIGTQLPDAVDAYQESNPGVPFFSIPLGINIVNGLAVDPTQTLLYVSLPYNGTVNIYSASTGAPKGSVSPPVVPGQVAVDPVHDRLYVASVGTGDVAVYDTTNNANTYLGLIANPGSPSSCDLAVDPAFETVFSANCNLPGNVTEMSGSTLSTTHVFAVGNYPQSLGLGGNGLLYVANEGSNNITVIDPATNATVNTFHVGLGPVQLAVDPSTNTLYTTNFTSPSLTVVNGTTGATAGSLAIPGGVSEPVFDDRTQTLLAAVTWNGTTFLASLIAAPLAPTGLTLVAGNGTVTANWTASAGSPGVPIQNYTVWTSAAAGGPWTLAVTTMSLTASFSGLPNGVPVYVTVRAVSEAGTSENTSAVGATPGAVPYPPTSVAAHANGTSVIEVSWAAPSSTGGFAVTNYTVWYGPASGPFHPMSAGTALSVTLTGLSADTNYTVYVVAYNSLGASHPSGRATATTAANPPSTSGTLGGLLAYWWLIAVVVAALAVLIALLLLRRRRKPTGAAAGVAGGSAGGPPAPWSEPPAPTPSTPPSGSGGPPPGAT